MLLPFFFYLCWEQAFISALSLIPVSLGLAIFTNLPQIQTTIPTPFKKFPFEFIIGFRKTFWFIFLVYLLSFKAFQVGNYNLAIFALAVLFFLSLSYYSKPEDEYYCWIFSMSPVVFLLKKIVSGLICLSILTLPIFMAIIVLFPENTWITIAVQLLGYIYLTSMVLAKYSGFPKGLNIAHGIFYGISILFPPLLIIIIPIFLSRITGWEYLKLLCVARKIKTENFEEQNIFDLPLNQYAESYSTGMKKKLALMGVLLQKNEIYILDEPFNGVDIHSNMIISEIIKKLKAKQKTILISSHIFSTLSDCCDTIHLLKNGEISRMVTKEGFSTLDQEMQSFVIGNKVDRLDI